jgi:hypothetical protein
MPREIQKIDIGDLTENVTAAVQRALEARGGPGNTPPPFGRIVLGIIIEPPVERPQ